MRRVTLLAGLPMALIAGCASIVTDSTQKVRIDSRPDTASVTVSDQSGRRVANGETPMSVTLDKAAGYFDGQRYDVRLAKSGYEDTIVTLKARPNGWYLAGNIVFGGFIGWLVVDPLTGAMFTLSPREVSADLRASSAQEGGDLELRVIMIADVPDGFHEDLRPVGTR